MRGCFRRIVHRAVSAARVRQCCAVAPSGVFVDSGVYAPLEVSVARRPFAPLCNWTFALSAAAVQVVRRGRARLYAREAVVRDRRDLRDGSRALSFSRSARTPRWRSRRYLAS
jgi:hypothetical protein